MRRMIVLSLVAVLLVSVAAGCHCCTTKVDTDGAEVAKICADCGQVKGTDLCCAEGQEACAKCGLVKGSPGCCKIN